MYPTRSLLFVIFFNVIFVNGTTIPLADRQDRREGQFYAKPCPDGLPGRVTQIQEQSLARSAIFITDCSPSRNNNLTESNPFKISTVDKRQEQLCSADCTNQCAYSVYPPAVAPSASDCANLLNQLNNRNTQFTVSALRTVTITYGTCLFQVDNMTSSPIIYCYTDWAARSQSLIDNCFPRSGGMCQGSHFLVVISVNTLDITSTAGSASAPTAAATDGNGTNTSSSVNGDGNASNSNSASVNTAESNVTSSSSGILPTPLNGSQSRGSGSHTTTLSNGSASFAAGGSSETGNQQSSTSSASIPVIVGAVLGLLSLLALIILILLWRRKKRAQRLLASLEGESSSPEFLMARATNVDPRLPALGSGNGAGTSETPMTEAVAGGSVWATSNKARMHAEEIMPGTRATGFSSIEPSAYTRKSRIGGSGRGGSRDHPDPHAQQTGDALSHRDRDAYASDSHPTLTGSSNPMSARAFSQAAAPSLSASGIDRLAESIVARMQGGDSTLQERIAEEAGSSNSMSARTFARAAAPNLSASDTDRLAESIVARMQGRDPAFLERIVEEAGSSVVTEDEPPPPWSAPGVYVPGL